MNIEDVRAKVLEISEIRDDDEVAHSREDDLYQAVLEAIAAGTAEDPAGMALLALTTKAIDFARWCA